MVYEVLWFLGVQSFKVPRNQGFKTLKIDVTRILLRFQGSLVSVFLGFRIKTLEILKPKTEISKTSTLNS
jgi:hypothetical protein